MVYLLRRPLQPSAIVTSCVRSRSTHCCNYQSGVSVLERIVGLAVVTVVLLNALASVLPRITPSLAVLGVLVLIGRAVWFYTR